MQIFGSVLFDEAHAEAWTIRPGIAARMNPANPPDSSYEQAAQTLRARGHEVSAYTCGQLSPDVLGEHDVLVLAHPADASERTTGDGSPLLSSDEIDALEDWVRAGGGLVVLGECDQDKSGNNLNTLLARFDMRIATTTVHDRNCHLGVATWVMAALDRAADSTGEDLLAGVQAACFYRAGVLDLDGPDFAVLARTSATADPAGAPLAASRMVGAGRVIVFADSDLFGDDSIDDYQHRQLWTNVVTWACAGRLDASLPAASAHVSKAASHPDWALLKLHVTALREMQLADGSIDLAVHDRDVAQSIVESIADAVQALVGLFPHDDDYLTAAVRDLELWATNDFGVPDFLDSLLLFRPEEQRINGREHLVLFPMYTQNGNPDRNFEALLLSVQWPDWLAELERTRFDNRMFVPINFVDFTPGYDTNSAVLFPETVVVREVPKYSWGGIFCDREAARFRRVSTAAAQTLKLSVPPAAARLLHNQEMAQNTFALWDLVHDRTHSHGDLPFDPFMIKQRMPFWMYALEELRCDLNAFRETIALEEDGVAYAPLVRYAILFDRLFRFPITGGRVRNYDGLGGQLLFAYLHRNDVLRWTDNALSLDWTRAEDVVVDLCREVEKLYRDGIDRSRVAHWLAAHQFMSLYVAPHPASVWARGSDALPLTGERKPLVDAVLPDEFPLNVFYEALRRRLGDVIESTSGIVA